MAGPDLAALRAQRGLLAQRLASAVADAQMPLAELQQMQARLQLIDGVLAGAAPRARPWRRTLWALAIVAALVSLVAWWPMPKAAFTLELEAAAASLHMPKAGQLGGQVIDERLRAEGFAQLASADPNLVQRSRDGAANQIAVQAEQLRLRRITYAEGANLAFTAGTESVGVAIDAAAHAAEFELGGAVSASMAGAERLTTRYAVAEWARLEAGKAPTELWFGRKAERVYRWTGLQPDTLRFTERQAGADGQGRRVSSLYKGLLRLPATGREVPLLAGSGLELDGLVIERAELALGERLQLKLHGTARRLALESGGFEQSLMPSLLEHLARNHSLALLWSAAGLLWGIVAWLRKTFVEGA